MDADTLSRLPLDIKKYMEVCTNEITTEALDTTVNAVLAQSKGEITLVSSCQLQPLLQNQIKDFFSIL